jgi:hypothetical protein
MKRNVYCLGLIILSIFLTNCNDQNNPNSSKQLFDSTTINSNSLIGVWKLNKPIELNENIIFNKYNLEFLPENKKVIVTMQYPLLLGDGEITTGGEYTISNNTVFVTTQGGQTVWKFSEGLLSTNLGVSIELMKIK